MSVCRYVDLNILPINMDLFAKSGPKNGLVASAVVYPFPVPTLPVSEAAARSLSSEWLPEEVQYTQNIVALVEVALNHQNGDARLSLLQPGSVVPLLPFKGEFSHPMTMTNGRAFEDRIALNPWRLWDIFGSAVTGLHELTHRANRDFDFADNAIEVASREIRTHRISVTDAQTMSDLVSRIPAPSDGVKEIWLHSIAVRQASHALQMVTYEVLRDIQLLLKSRIEAIPLEQGESRRRIIGEFSNGSLKDQFQLLNSLWRAGEENIPVISPPIEALLANSDISALLDESERARWKALGKAHQEAASELSKWTNLNTACIARFGPTKVVPPRRIGNYFN